MSEVTLNQTTLIKSGPLKAMLGGISDMTLWRWQRNLGFPASIKIGGSVRFWKLDEVEAWIASRDTAKSMTEALANAGAI